MSVPEDVPYLDYHVRWRAGQSRPGRHAARHAGSGGDVRGCLPFWQLPDARRIDMRRSIMDPAGQVMVRQTQQRSSITLLLAADVSRSMQPSPGRSGLAQLATLAQAAARSALRSGDAFGLLAFDRSVRPDISVAPTRARTAAAQMVANLQGLQPTGTDNGGIAQLADHVPHRRCLVLLASDFLMPLNRLDRALASLATHDVAPIMFQSDGPEALPRAGVLRLADAETGRTRLVLMRPALHRKWCEIELARLKALEKLFQSHGRAAFQATGNIDISALSEHLMAGA